MNLSRIKALFFQELYISRGSLDLFFDFLFIPTISIIIFGFEYLFFSKKLSPDIAAYLLMGTILWQIFGINQYVICYNSNVNMWSRNLSNLFVTPLSTLEYVSAQFVSGIVKTAFIIFLTSLISFICFKFNILDLGPINLILFSINLTMFAWALGLVIMGIIYRFGSRLQAITWGLIAIFQPLCAVFFPVNVLPDWLQKIAFLLPPTYVFEAAREALKSPVINWEYFLTAFWLNLVLFTMSLWFFHFMFEKSKETGQFARNEG